MSNVKTPNNIETVSKKDDIQNIIENYFNDKIGYGQKITTVGYLSNYVLRHRPDLFSSHNAKLKNMRVLENTSTNSGKIVKGEIKTVIESDTNLTQFPIQTIPSFSSLTDNKLLYVYFLYDPSLSSFHLPSKDNSLIIDSTHKPIIVISDQRIIQETENVVKISGVLKEFDENLQRTFLESISDLQSDILSNTFRAYNQTLSSLCIDLREQGEIQVLKHRNSMPATIYVESHLENIPINRLLGNLIGNSIPNTLPKEMNKWIGFQPMLACGATYDDVLLVSRDFVSFAFYLETDLQNQVIYQQKLKQLKKFIDAFKNNIQANAYKKFHKNVKMEIDFLFDHTKALVFQPKGILKSEVTKSLMANDSSTTEVIEAIKKENPECFISYSWDDEEHQQWVKILATRLTENGVYVKIDQWDTYNGGDLPQYMETAIRDSDFVLLICTPKFAQKANASIGGVGYEKDIIAGEISTKTGPLTKFTPILRRGNPHADKPPYDKNNDPLPSYLRSKKYLDFRDNSQFENKLEELLRHIYAIPKNPRPPLGQKPSFVIEATNARINTTTNNSIINSNTNELISVSTEIERVLVTTPDPNTLILKPLIQNLLPDSWTLNFELSNEGDKDIDIIEIEAAVPKSLIKNNWGYGFDKNVLEVEDNKDIDGQPHLLFKYKVYDGETNPAYGTIERLQPTISPSMSARILKPLKFCIKRELTELDKLEFIIFKIVAKNIKTKQQKVMLKTLFDNVR